MALEKGMRNMDPGNLEGLIPLLGGIYMFYLAYATSKQLPGDPAKAEAAKRWREKLVYLAPLMIVFGLVLLSGILR
jgi:hypothetical protein